MSKWKLSIWWKEHSPGDVVEAELREIGALVSFGFAHPVEEKKSVKRGEDKDDSTSSGDSAS